MIGIVIVIVQARQALKEAKMQRSQAKKAGSGPPAVAGAVEGAKPALTDLHMPILMPKRTRATMKR